MKYLYFIILLFTLLSISIQNFLNVEYDKQKKKTMKKLKNNEIKKLKTYNYSIVEKNIQSYNERSKVKKLLEDLLKAVKKDRELIDNVFQIKDFQFFEFSLGISEMEMHADGKGVVIMSFKNDDNVVKKVVYKSYSLLTYFTFSGKFYEIENFFKSNNDLYKFVKGKMSVFETINSSLTQSYLPVYKIIPMEINVGKDDYMLSSYGYIEFIEQDSHIAAGFLSHIGNYLNYKFLNSNYSSYWNNDKLTFSHIAGLISAASEVFKMQDFHGQNIILKEKRIFLIDIENVFDFNVEKSFSANVFLDGIREKYPHQIDRTRFIAGATDFLFALKIVKEKLINLFKDNYLQNNMMFRVIPVYTKTWSEDGKYIINNIEQNPKKYFQNLESSLEKPKEKKSMEQKIALLLHIDDNTIKDTKEFIIPILFGKLNENNYFTVRNERIDYSKSYFNSKLPKHVRKVVKKKFKNFTEYYNNLRKSIESITPIKKIEEYINKDWEKEGLIDELSGLL